MEFLPQNLSFIDLKNDFNLNTKPRNALSKDLTIHIPYMLLTYIGLLCLSTTLNKFIMIIVQGVKKKIVVDFKTSSVLKSTTIFFTPCII